MSGIRPVYSGLYILFVVEDQIILFVHLQQMDTFINHKIMCLHLTAVKHAIKILMVTLDSDVFWWKTNSSWTALVYRPHFEYKYRGNLGKTISSWPNFDIWKTRLTFWYFSFWTFCSLLLTFLFLKPRRSLCPLHLQ